MTPGNRNIAWIETFLRIPEGKYVGRPVRLSPFQKKVIRGIYNSPTRLAIISYGRKNAKTTLAGMICLLHLVGPEARRNSQLYSAAQSREQAGVLFSLMAKMIRMSPDLKASIAIRESAKTLVCPELGAEYRALSAEATTAYGLSPAVCVHDELGQVVGPRSQLYEALETAQAAHDRPLSVIISTQAASDGDLLSTLIDDAKTARDPEVKLYLWTAPDDVNPFSRKAIRAANPAFDHFMNKEEVMRMAANAERMPTREADYRNLVLNQRVNRNNPFVTATVWKENGAEPREEDFQGGTVAGLDLSELVDLTALVWVGKGNDGAWSVGCDFWTPEEGIRERSLRDRVPYDVWAKQGLLKTTPGSSIDYSFVAQCLVDFADKYPVHQMTFDRWGMRIMRAELAHLGHDDLPLDENGHGQGTRDMTPALIALETELLNGNLRHGNHPILAWCARNAVVWKSKGAAAERKLDKSKSTGRIDGMVALAMAMNRALALTKAPSSPWEDESFSMVEEA